MNSKAVKAIKIEEEIEEEMEDDLDYGRFEHFDDDELDEYDDLEGGDGDGM